MGRVVTPDCPCLGLTISGDASHQAALGSLVSKIRGAVFALKKNRGFGFLGNHQRAVVASRAIIPLIDFCVPILRPTEELFWTLDSL